MPRPSETGTSVNGPQTGGQFIDITMTIPADATTLVVAFGGWGAGATVTVTSVQIDPLGTPFDLDDVTLFNQLTTQQYGGIYAMHDTNANWPGSGSVTVRVTLSASGLSLMAELFCLTDVDTGGTPENGTATAASASGTPSAVLTSSANALNIASIGSYSADAGGAGGDDTVIGEEQNGAAAASFYCWSEEGTGSSDTIEANASVSYGMVAVSFEGTASGVALGTITETGTVLDLKSPSTLGIVTGTGTVISLQPGVTLGTVTETGTVQALGVAGTWVNDTFDGTGALGSHWVEYNPVIDAARVSGYMEIDVDDNTGDKTVWFQGDRGRLDSQLIKFPLTGEPSHIYQFLDCGVGPTSNPRNDLTKATAFAINFGGVIAHNANMTIEDWMFAVIGHRGADGTATIEHKSTNNGVSTQADEGDNVVGSGATHCDFQVEVQADGTILFGYRARNTSNAFTLINGGTGLTQGTPPNLGSNGDSFRLGVVGYALGTQGVPFISSADVAKLVNRSLGTVTEIGEVQPLSTGSGATLGTITETGTVLSLKSPVTLGVVTEVGEVLPIVSAVSLGVVTEVGEVRILRHPVSLGIVTEFGQVRPLNPPDSSGGGAARYVRGVTRSITSNIIRLIAGG